MINKLIKEVIKVPRTVVQTTAKEAVKLATWEEDDDD